MAIALDTFTRFPLTETTGFDTATGDQTFTHTPVGTPKGVVIVLGAASNAGAVTGILYGGVPMEPIVAANDATEIGRIEVWALTETTVPTGAQTVTLQGCSAAQKWVSCVTVTATTSQTRVNGFNSKETTVSTNPTLSIGTTATTMAFGGIHGGAAAPTNYVMGAGMSAMNNADYGAMSARSARRTNPDAAGTVTFNFTFATSDDHCIAAVALEEYESSAGVDGSGAIVAPAAQIAGTGDVVVTGSGAVAPAAPVVAGAATVTVTGSGAVTAPAAHVAGSGTATVTGSGQVTAPAGVVAGTGTVVVDGAGAMVAPAAVISGAGIVGELPEIPPAFVLTIPAERLLSTMAAEALTRAVPAERLRLEVT